MNFVVPFREKIIRDLVGFCDFGFDEIESWAQHCRNISAGNCYKCGSYRYDIGDCGTGYLQDRDAVPTASTVLYDQKGKI